MRRAERRDGLTLLLSEEGRAVLLVKDTAPPWRSQSMTPQVSNGSGRTASRFTLSTDILLALSLSGTDLRKQPLESRKRR